MEKLYFSIIIILLIVMAIGFVVLYRYYNHRINAEVTRARRSEHIKTVFLANVSHALRHPLSSIISTSEGFLSADTGTVSARQINDAFVQINKDGNQLLYFISQLIELSNFESGVLTFTQVEVNLAELMASYRREAQRDAAPGVSVMVRSPLSPHCKGTLDTNLMYQLMMRLLHGAVERTKSGTIAINYESEANGLKVVVSDSGEGVQLDGYVSDALQNDQSFALFSQDSGLGLSICKSIVDSMGGEITVESVPGKGTTSTVFFPCRLRHKHKGI